MITHWFNGTDDRVHAIILTNTPVGTGHHADRWPAGRAFVPACPHVACSHTRIPRQKKASGPVSPFRHPPRFATGHGLGRPGRFLAHAPFKPAKSGEQAATSTANRHQHQRPNSPTDQKSAPAGAIWFTVPRCGMATAYKGGPAKGAVAPPTLCPPSFCAGRKLMDIHLQPDGAAHG